MERSYFGDFRQYDPGLAVLQMTSISATSLWDLNLRGLKYLVLPQEGRTIRPSGTSNKSVTSLGQNMY